MTLSQPTATATATPAAPAALYPTLPQRLFGDDGLQFRDLLDLVNPLQHIPLLGNLYRRMTGDVLDPAIRVAGGALFGGPIGAGLAAAALAFKAWTAAPDAAVAPPAATDLARPPTRYEARGGWLVAATRQIAMAPEDRMAETRPAHDGNIAKRRGGWLAQAAYAMADARAAAPRGRIDTST